MNFFRRNLCCLLMVSGASAATAQTTPAPPTVMPQGSLVQLAGDLPGINQEQDKEPQPTADPQAASPQPTPQPTADPPTVFPQSNPQPTASPTPTPPPAPTPTAEEQEREIQKREQSQRILGVAPHFSVTSRQNAPPLTSGQKFHLFVKSAFDPFAFAAAGIQSGISQATNEFPGYGQGAAGYGKRYGASFADQVSSNFFANFAYPVLLKEDPRYFRLGEGSIKHRIVYSLEQEFICRTDKGGHSFNFSNVLGAFSSGGLSNVYYPGSDRGLSLTMSRSAISLIYGSLGGLIDEFWTDIDQKLFHKKNKNPPTIMGPTPK